MATLRCSDLSSRTNFASYISLLRNSTNDNFSLVANCREEVCGALWGSGNPDISGIGMTVGYLLESIICLTLLAIYGWFAIHKKQTKGRRLLTIATAYFFDNAIFFTFAIQIASVVTLVRANFGLSAEGMGAISMKIAWTVSTLTLLPLLPLVLRPEVFMETTDQNDSASEAENKQLPSARNAHGLSPRRRHGHRFLLFVICWAVSFYPFFSHMAGTFGKSEIGGSSDTPDTVISTSDWTTIETACFENVKTVNSAQDSVMTAFGVGSWLLIALVVIYKIVLSMLKAGHHERQLQWLKRRGLTSQVTAGTSGWIWLAICAVVTLCVIVQFWSYFRLRQFQSDMTTAAGGKFPDGQLTFGQIVAVVVFLPVAAEVLFQWRE